MTSALKISVCSLSKLIGSSGQFPALDGLRAIAIILVLLRHSFVSFLGLSGGGSVGYKWLDNALLNGWAGVDLFFVLSGFLITHHLLNRYKNQRIIDFLGRYFLKRILRTFPVYYAGIGLCVLGLFPFYEVEVDDLTQSVVNHVVFMQDYYGADILVPLWSLATEEKFYILAPLLLLFLKYISNNRYLLAVIICVFIALPLMMRLDLAAKLDLRNYTDFFWMVRAPFHLALDGVLLGAFVALIFHATNGLRISSKLSYFLFMSGVVSATFLLVYKEWMSGGNWELASWVLLLFPLSFSMILFGCLNSTVLNKGFLASKQLLFFSKLSYSMYVVHFALIPFIDNQYNKLIPADNFSFISYLIFFAAITIIASVCLHIIVERPFLKIKGLI